ncbi:MAG: hypothetical protein FJ152_04780 [Firmicutes bacterium]|nr:hypothetical protein [Bacillota bacterium]
MIAPSRESLERACVVIEKNLVEMGIIVAYVSAYSPLATDTDRRTLLYISSCLYDFYLLVEECLLQIARITDRWIPGSLDWHYRLIRLLRAPVPDQRPPVLSGRTVLLLEDYLVLYINYHQHSPVISSVKIERMISNLPVLHQHLENELLFLNKLVMPRKRSEA